MKLETSSFSGAKSNEMQGKPEKLEHPFLDAAADLSSRYIEDAKAQGKKVIGYSCSYIPRELLDTANLVPYRMRAPYNTVPDQADAYLNMVNCSFIRCVLEAMFDERLDFLDGYVFTASCDHLRRLYDNVRYLFKPKLCHILDVPHKTHDDAAAWLAEEFELLRKNIGSSMSVKLDDEGLSESISRTNEVRKILGRIQELRKRAIPALTGEEMQRIMVAIHSVSSEVAIKELADLYARLEEREISKKYRARLLLMGSHMDDPAYIAAMEEMGGLVVADTFCVGSVHFSDPVDEDAAPIQALSRRYLRKMACPRMFEAFEDRYRRVVNTAREYQVDGIVLETMKFCDTWGIDAVAFMEALREDGFEVLRLEREYTRGGVGQLRTRVQAFIEMLEK